MKGGCQPSISYNLSDFDRLSQRETVTGRLVSCRAATNFSMPSSRSPDGSSPSKKIFSRLDNASVVLAPTSSCMAGATHGTNFLRRKRFLQQQTDVMSRGINPGEDLLQIFVGPFEQNPGETGEDRVCQLRLAGGRQPSMAGRGCEYRN